MNPLVFGRLIVDPSYPTVIVYGHYDVQPAVAVSQIDEFIVNNKLV